MRTEQRWPAHPHDQMRSSIAAAHLIVGDRLLVDGSDHFATIISITMQPSPPNDIGKLTIAVAPLHPEDMAGPQLVEIHPLSWVIRARGVS